MSLIPSLYTLQPGSAANRRNTGISNRSLTNPGPGSSVFGSPGGRIISQPNFPVGLASFPASVVPTPSASGFDPAPTGCYYVQPLFPLLDQTNFSDGNTNGFTLSTNSPSMALFNNQPVLVGNISEVSIDGAPPWSAPGNQLSLGQVVIVWPTSCNIMTAAGVATGVMFLCAAEQAEGWAKVTGTIAQGETYTGHLAVAAPFSITSGYSASFTTAAVFIDNTSETLTLMNVGAAGSTWHLVGTNTYVFGSMTSAVDENNGPPGTGAPILVFSKPNPPILKGTLNCTNTSSGTATLSGTVWSTNTFTYNAYWPIGAAQMQTMGLNLTPDDIPVAGPVNPGSRGLLMTESGSNVYSLWRDNDNQPMTQCGT